MTLEAILASPFLTGVVVRSLIVGVLVSLCSALLGVSLVLKRYSMIGDGMSHVGFFALALCTAAGVAGAYTMEASLPVV
ncbi:MAG: metal ABC transporter permease, partial [Clostridia bacterium]|nr:metal ABC transporter permease [Clostridia bacterium]